MCRMPYNEPMVGHRTISAQRCQPWNLPHSGELEYRLTYGPSASDDQLPAFPMARACPFSPPPAYQQIREERPVAPVRLWNGKKAWLVSRFGDVRKILADKRVSNNILHPGFPLLYEARSAVFKQYDKPPYFHFMD